MARVAALTYYIDEDWVPALLIDVDDSGPEAWAYDGETGGFRFSPRHVRDPYGRVYRVTREAFIQQVEECRARDVTEGRLGWEGPVVPLYETMTALLGRRSVGPEERAFVRALSLRTHLLFEAELKRRGGAGLPREGDPVPVDPRFGEQASFEWRALPDELVGEFARRLAGLGAALRDCDAAAVAAGLDRPVAQKAGGRLRLDSGLPLTEGDIWLERHRDGCLSVDVPLTDSGVESHPEFFRFLSRRYRRAAQLLQEIYDRPWRQTGGRWPERSWQADGVGVFLRRGGNRVHLLAMPQAQAASRFEQVAREVAEE